MFDGSILQTTHSLTEILGWVKELSIIGFLLGVAWKARGVWDKADHFLDRIADHMDRMERFADRAEHVFENHLVHIEKSLRVMSNEKDPDDNNS